MENTLYLEINLSILDRTVGRVHMNRHKDSAKPLRLLLTCLRFLEKPCSHAEVRLETNMLFPNRNFRFMSHVAHPTRRAETYNVHRACPRSTQNHRVCKTPRVADQPTKRPPAYGS